MAVWGGLKNSCEQKRSEKQKRKERYKHLNAEFQRITRRYKKAFLSDQCKETEEKKTEWVEFSCEAVWTWAFVCWKIFDYSFNFHACDGSVMIFYFFLVQFWKVVLF